MWVCVLLFCQRLFHLCSCVGNFLFCGFRLVLRDIFIGYFTFFAFLPISVCFICMSFTRNYISFKIFCICVYVWFVCVFVCYFLFIYYLWFLLPFHSFIWMTVYQFERQCSIRKLIHNLYFINYDLLFVCKLSFCMLSLNYSCRFAYYCFVARIFHSWVTVWAGVM